MATSRTIRAGRAMVEIFADDSRLARGLQRAQRRLQAWGNNIQSIGRQAIRIGAIVSAPLLATTRLFGQMGDQLAITASRTGMSVEALSELRHAMEDTGASGDALNAALFRMRRRIANAAGGTGPAVRALDELGLSAETLTRLSTEDQLDAIADALAGLPDEGRAAQLAFELFGGQAEAMFPLLRRGSAGLAELRQEARDFGFTVSTRAAVAASLFSRRLRLLGGSMRMVAFEIGGALAPSVGDVVERMRSGVQLIQEFIAANRGMVVSALAIGAALIISGVGLVALGLGIKLLIPVLGLALISFKAVGVAIGVTIAMFTGLLSPIGLVVAALAVVTAAVARTTGAWSAAAKWIGDRFGELAGRVRDVVGGIADALVAGDVQLAAEVLWAGLQVAWLTGTTKLREIWTSALQAMRDQFNRIFGPIRDFWDQHFGIDRQIAVARRDFMARKAEITTDDMTAREKAEAIAADPEASRLFDEMRELERERERLHKARSADPASDSRNEALAEAQERLEQAQQDLEEAIGRARQRREQFDAEGPPDGVRTSFEDLFKKINDMITDTADRVQIRGAFGGQAIEQIVGGLITVDAMNRADERTADACEKTAEEAEKIVKETKRVGDNTARPQFTVYGP